MTQKKTLTVVVREISSPYPPVAPWPLFYTLSMDDFSDENTIRAFIADIRMLELDAEDENYEAIYDGIELLFAFEGDLETKLDWRN